MAQIRWMMLLAMTACDCGSIGFGCSPCETDDDCFSGEFCRDAECVQCRTSADCAGDVAVCLLGMCHECAESSDCELGSACEDNSCRFVCLADLDCPESFRCRVPGQCVSSCACDDDCAENFCSREGYCIEPFPAGRFCPDAGHDAARDSSLDDASLEADVPDSNADAGGDGDMTDSSLIDASEGAPDSRVVEDADIGVSENVAAYCTALTRRALRCGIVPEPIEACHATYTCRFARFRDDVTSLADACLDGLPCAMDAAECFVPERLGLMTTPIGATFEVECSDRFPMCDVDCRGAHHPDAVLLELAACFDDSCAEASACLEDC